MSETGFTGDDFATTRAKGKLRTGFIRKKVGIETDVLTLARERMREIYRLHDYVIVSFSGGKDSTAVLNLTIEAASELGKLPVHAIFFDEEAIPYETEDYVRRVAAREDVRLDWYCLPVKHRNGCSRRSPYWYCWAPEDEAKWVRALPPEAITAEDLPGWPREPEKRYTIPDTTGLLFPSAKYGRTALVMGIRGQESITRTRAVLMRTNELPYIKKIDSPTCEGNVYKAYPIYDWQTEDVWNAPKRLGWDYNRAYDRLEAAGVSHLLQRCAPPYGEEPMAALWTFAVCFPDIWPKMQSRVPGAATAARYAQTVLYSFGKKPDKPPGMPWPQFLKLWIDKHPDKIKGDVAMRVQRWIGKHYRQTADPIADKALHPVTGVSWTFLLDIAIRGDLKDRRQVSNLPPEAYDKNLAKYKADIADMRARGELPGQAK